MADGSLAVIILAAGQGTRMKSALPKVLHTIAGRSLIQHVLDVAWSLDTSHVLAVVRHERERVSGAILEHAPDTVIVDQDEIPGTGRAVEQALEALPDDFDGSVVVLSGDVPLIDAETLQVLISGHLGHKREMTLLSAIFDDPTGLGRIIRDDDQRMQGIVEEKDATDIQRRITEVNGGIYVFNRRSLQRALGTIDTNNAQGEKYLTDAAALLLGEGGVVDAIPTTDTWLISGVNDRSQLTQVGVELNRRILRKHQHAGVTIQDPDTTWIDAEVTIGADTVILPGTFIHGATTIASHVIVGPDTTLVDCDVREGAHIRRSEVNLAVIGEGASVGPFSYIRPGTELGQSGKIGAFVEAKNAVIGAGSKVPHLSYVGDITIGDDSNIGAGTIVANYDGVKKHQTEVGTGVRVGSQNVLVAPVTVGDGAYTAAGTVVRKHVPAGSLSMGVTPQRHIEGWVVEKRPGSSSARAAEQAGETQES